LFARTRETATGGLQTAATVADAHMIEPDTICLVAAIFIIGILNDIASRSPSAVVGMSKIAE
jgi:hypothetical protein